MRLLASLALLAALPLSADWTGVLDAAGLAHSPVALLEGDAPEALALGFRKTEKRVTVQSVTDHFQPKLRIVWQTATDVAVYEPPAGARVFTRERWTGAPLVAGVERNGRNYLWTAVPPGERGYERFPFLVQALGAMGAAPRVEGRHLWAFFDSSYRLRADVEYLAKQWRAGGLSAIHVAAWHYWEADAQRDQWLARLIEACHRNAILVYAWIEFPHVSEKFWQDHPQWREKTGTGQDAHLDWRKLMNLADPDCSQAVSRSLDALAARFDWDGINLGELYFESLEGIANPARFTPFNDTVRREFAAQGSGDLAAVFRSPKAASAFLDYRARLAQRLQEQWLARLAAIRASRPHLDLVLTHIDDRFDTTMRDKLGADAARLIPTAEKLGVTFLVEDPATVWHFGPARYTEIARRYKPIVTKPELLAIDLNIVERYQDVYPTKQQTGVELLQLVNHAARAFQRVALYFENSIASEDWPWLAAASAAPVSEKWDGNTLEIETLRPTAVRWTGCATVNGRSWPARDGDRLLLPAGKARVEPCDGPAGTSMLKDFNGNLIDVRYRDGRLEIEYESATRAIAVLGGARGQVVMLPPGRRKVAVPWGN